jgi:hypothetical protein
MSARNISLVVKASGALGSQIYHIYAIWKSNSRNPLGLPWPALLFLALLPVVLIVVVVIVVVVVVVALVVVVVVVA